MDESVQLIAHSWEGELMICELLRTTVDGQEAFAIIRYQNGKLLVEPLKGQGPRFAESILQTKGYVDGQWITSQSNPEKWFYALPSTFNGSYVRARMMTSRE